MAASNDVRCDLAKNFCAAAANAADTHQAALSTATDNGTMVTDIVSGKPARFLCNTLIDALAGDKPRPFPTQLRLTALLAEASDAQYMAYLLGTSAALTVEMPAGELVQKLVDDISTCFKEFA